MHRIQTGRNRYRIQRTGRHHQQDAALQAILRQIPKLVFTTAERMHRIEQVPVIQGRGIPPTGRRIPRHSQKTDGSCR